MEGAFVEKQFFDQNAYIAQTSRYQCNDQIKMFGNETAAATAAVATLEIRSFFFSVDFLWFQALHVVCALLSVSP